MEISTKYKYVPLYHAFQWGIGTVTFDVDNQLEELKEIRYPLVYKGQNHHPRKSLQLFIESVINKNLSFKSCSTYGDIREPLFQKTRELISKNIDLNIDERDYDDFAIKYGFMTKKQIVEKCK